MDGLYDVEQHRPREMIDKVVSALLATTIEPSWRDKFIHDLGVDSMGAMQIISRLRALRGEKLTLSISGLYSLTIGELWQTVNQSDAGAHQATSIDWGLEAKFERTSVIPDQLKLDRSDDSRPRACLLTGVTGFIGPVMLASLLTQFPSHTFLCLVRGADDGGTDLTALQRRTHSALELAARHGVPGCSDALKVLSSGDDRVVFLPGDLSAPNLGVDFDSDSFGVKLLLGAGVVDCVVHNGAHVSSLLPYRALKQANVEATATVANLALDLGASLVFVSSTSSIGGLVEADGPVSEVYTTPFAAFPFMTGYGQTKAIAERRLYESASLIKVHHQQFLVLRLGLIGASSIGGDEIGASYSNATDWLQAWGRAVLALRVIPEGTMGPLEILPVDCAAFMIAALAKKVAERRERPCMSTGDAAEYGGGGSPCLTLHLCGAQRSSTYAAFRLALEKFIGLPRCEEVSLAEFRRRLCDTHDDVPPLVDGDGPMRVPHSAQALFSKTTQLPRTLPCDTTLAQDALSWLDETVARPSFIFRNGASCFRDDEEEEEYFSRWVRAMSRDQVRTCTDPN